MANERIAATVRLAKERLGADDYVALAVSLGIIPKRALNRSTLREHDRNKARKVANWERGESGPQFVYAMTMLSRAGLLQPEAEAAWSGVSLEEAEHHVDALRRMQAAMAQAGRLNASQPRPQDARRPA